MDGTELPQDWKRRVEAAVGRAMVMTNDLSGAFSWSSAIDLGATSYVADPPSFGYVPQLTREAGIFWTEVD